MHSSDRAHPLDTVDRKFRNGKGEKRRKQGKMEDRSGVAEKEKKRGRKKRKLYGYICFRHFLLLMPPLKAQRTSPEIPYAR